ncbi:hypothetical protein FBZ89_13610 [Nitrospirillum amazonense]|uniref:Uncharacterized protein n=1 Tax=Nitrospirillum amazonense TaxID=28077 RepID=A0A560EL28_9PROT|nr:hypothetical protein [Nitrospirillum amazonense]TWB10073.1 hypothetical protein FBZ89_13610 [Nitrospirillum amazonense]
MKKSGYTQADYDSAIALFERALCLFGLVGGLGSRARRGWGSIALHALEGSGSETFTRPTTVEDYIVAVKKQLPKHAHDPLPPYTAVGRDSRVEVVVPDDGNALSVLDTMGKAMQRYRSWGHTKKHSDSGPLVNDQPSEKNFQDDHDWFRKNSDPRFRTPDFVPRRSIFGLPHNYGDGFGVAPSQPGMDRRASPLLLHVHPLAADWFIGVALLLPARFLPGEQNGETLVTVKINQRNATRPYTVDWKVLNTLLDGYPQPDGKGRAPYFPNKRPVYP